MSSSRTTQGFPPVDRNIDSMSEDVLIRVAASDEEYLTGYYSFEYACWRYWKNGVRTMSKDIYEWWPLPKPNTGIRTPLTSCECG